MDVFTNKCHDMLNNRPLDLTNENWSVALVEKGLIS